MKYRKKRLDKIDEARLKIDYAIFHAPFTDAGKEQVAKSLRYLVRLAKRAS